MWRLIIQSALVGVLSCAGLMSIAPVAWSHDAGELTKEQAAKVYPAKPHFSPYAERNFPARPLDFLVVADHSDNMDFFPDFFAGKPELLAGVHLLENLRPRR